MQRKNIFLLDLPVLKFKIVRSEHTHTHRRTWTYFDLKQFPEKWHKPHTYTQWMQTEECMLLKLSNGKVFDNRWRAHSTSHIQTLTRAARGVVNFEIYNLNPEKLKNMSFFSKGPCNPCFEGEGSNIWILCKSMETDKTGNNTTVGNESHFHKYMLIACNFFVRLFTWLECVYSTGELMWDIYWEREKKRERERD